MCHNTEVHFLALEESDPVPFNCMCDDFSTSCSWSSFADRRNILNGGTSHSLFMWQKSIGYGQYICVDDNSIVAKDILILPQSEENNEL